MEERELLGQRPFRSEDRHLERCQVNELAERRRIDLRCSVRHQRSNCLDLIGRRSATRSHFEQDPTGEEGRILLGRVLESCVEISPAFSLASVGDAGVAGDRFGDRSQSSLENLAARIRDDEQVDVFRESFDQVVGLREARASFEYHGVDAVVVCTGRPQHLGRPVVLLDRSAGDAETFGGAVSERLELGG